MAKQLLVTESALTAIAMCGSSCAVIVGMSWALSARLTGIEARLSAIPSMQAQVSDLATAVAHQDTSVQLIKQEIVNLKKPLANTQANVRKILKQNKATAVASPFNLGPYGTR